MSITESSEDELYKPEQTESPVAEVITERKTIYTTGRVRNMLSKFI